MKKIPPATFSTILCEYGRQSLHPPNILVHLGNKEFMNHRTSLLNVQSGASGLAKHGGAYFSAIYGSIQDPIAAPGPYENQEP